MNTFTFKDNRTVVGAAGARFIVKRGADKLASWGGFTYRDEPRKFDTIYDALCVMQSGPIIGFNRRSGDPVQIILQ